MNTPILQILQKYFAFFLHVSNKSSNFAVQKLNIDSGRHTINGNSVMKKYWYFQLDKTCNDYRAKIFSSLSFLKKMEITPDFKDYEEVYNGEIEGEDDLAMCEALFAKFNMNHPSDYAGRSMSVSDVVRIEDKYYYCDNFGFTEIHF